VRKLFLGVLFLLLVAFGLRFWRLDKSPASLYVDEVDLGYQARSLLATGKDYRGGEGLVIVKSFNADRLPMSVWGAMLSTKFFADPFYQVRGGSALVGVIVVLTAAVLVWYWSRNSFLVLVTTFVFAVSPWMIQFSRIGFEGMYEVLMVLLVFVGWQLYLSKRDWGLLVFVMSLGLSLYTYRSMSLLVWVLVFVFLLIYRKDFLKIGWKKIVVGTIIFLLLAVPHYWKTVLKPSDELRINQISIFSDKLIPIKVIRNRELASGDYESDQIGRSATLWSKVFYNKPISYLDALTNNYLKAWSNEFLFVSGDPNPRHAPGGMGMLYAIDVIGLFAGLWYFVQNRKDKFLQSIAAALLLAPFGSIITEGGGTHAHRLLVFGVLLLLVVSIGWWQIVSQMILWRWPLIVLYVFSVCFYIVKYQVNYPYETFRSFGYGYKEMSHEVKKIESSFEKIEFTQSMDPPIFYYLFWNNVAPDRVIAYGTNFSDSTIKNQELDKYKALEWPEGIKFAPDLLQKNTLYVLTQKELPFDLRDEKMTPKGIKVWKTILYPDGTPEFYLISRD
jgi:hypothetical protein